MDITEDRECLDVNILENRKTPDVDIPEDKESLDVDIPENTKTPDLDIPENTKTSDVDIPENTKTLDLDITENTKTPDLDITENTKTPDVDIAENTKTLDVDITENTKTPDVDIPENMKTLDVDITENTKTLDVDITENTKTPDLDITVNTKTPDVDITENTMTPDVEILEARETHDVEILEGRETLDVEILEGRETPDVDITENTKTPDVDMRENTKTLDVDITENTKTPDLDITENTKTPDVDMRENTKTLDVDITENTKTPDVEILEARETHDVEILEDRETPDVNLMGDGESLDILEDRESLDEDTSEDRKTHVIPNSDDSDCSVEYPMLIPKRKMTANKDRSEKLDISLDVSGELDNSTDDTENVDIARDVSNGGIFVSLARKREISKTGKTKKNGRVYDSKHPCPFCDKIVSNFSHHILTKSHEQEEEVVMIKQEEGKKRKGLITKLRLKAAHEHNLSVLKDLKGEIYLLRRTASPTDDLTDDDETDEEEDNQQTFDIRKYGPCPKCLGWILQKSVKRHMRTCSSDLVSTDSKSSLILQSDILIGRILESASQALTSEVFPIMQLDDVSDIAKKDELIISLGNQWMMRNRGNKIMRKYYTSSIMRLAAKLKMECQTLTGKNDATLDEFLTPNCFDTVVQASLNCCNVGEMDEEDLNAPSNAIKLGYDIKRMLSTKLAKAIRFGNEKKMKEAEEFRKLMEIEWGLRVAKLARTLLAERSFNTERKLPLPEDVKKLASFLQSEIGSLHLDDTSFLNFKKAAILTLVRITLFNRRRCHEVQAMRLSSYAARKSGIDAVGQELRGELTKFENHLLLSQEMVVIRGKTGRGVPAILPQDVKEPLRFLADLKVRQEAGILPNNPYVFANAGAGVFRAYDAIRQVAGDPKAGLISPDLVRTSNMRKYMATMLQAMNTDETERQWIIDHLGHTLNVHKVHYRQTSDVLERIDVAKILLIQDLGLVGKFRGKKLDEIQLDEIVENEQDPIIQQGTSTQLQEHTKNLKSTPEDIDENFIPVPDLLQLEQQAEREEEDDDEFEPPAAKKRKQSKPSIRQKWTAEEEQELLCLFKTDFKDDKLPGQKRLEQIIKTSRNQNGVIHLRPRDNIKKKLSNMMIKRRLSR